MSGLKVRAEVTMGARIRKIARRQEIGAQESGEEAEARTSRG